MKKNEMRDNEFIIVTEGGLRSFEAHLHEIESGLAETADRPHRLGEKNLLMLCFPHPGMENEEFSCFFASPDNINHLCGGYSGCFAVDLSDYVNHPESRRLSELLNYMRERKEITFVLFAADDGSSGIAKLSESMRIRSGCKVGFATENGIEWKCGPACACRAFGY